MTENDDNKEVINSWRNKKILQQPSWDDDPRLSKALSYLKKLPPLVFAGEVRDLHSKLADAVEGKAFLLQAGDCAETFEGVTAPEIQERVKTILQMATVLSYGASVPVIKVGRLAGQFAKPRSEDSETREGVELPSFRGDIVNGFEFTKEARVHNPERLVEAYNMSAATLNLIRAFTQGGYADLRLVHEWNKGIFSNGTNKRYEALAKDIDRAMRFMEASGGDIDALKRADFYASHEALLLEYESALTRVDSLSKKPFDTSAHFVWIGERTRGLDDAHVDFLSQVANPIGVKLGPTATAGEAVDLAKKLNPDNIPGRLTFITRMGADKIRETLPKIVKGVEDAGLKVVWVCDPMHGNTIKAKNGYKTRRFDDVLAEVKGFFAVHKKLGTIPGGLHVEMTGNNVTECLGGFDEIDDEQLANRYESVCDPRLNKKQSVELAFQVAEFLKERNNETPHPKF
ncbi:MAG: 3-deoxy-7-phosphoheptulonate synthase class II [Micrococcaceae bacterium]